MLTDYAENQIIDYFRGQAMALPTDWYLGLISGFDSEGGFIELAGSDYGRIPIARSLAAWAGTQGAGSLLASTGTSHATSNNAEADFGSGFSGTAAYYGLFDAATDGNLWFALPLAVPMVIDVSDPVSFAAGTVAVTIGLAGGLSNFASNRLVDLIFRGQEYAWPPTTYVGYTTTIPTNASPGTEPSGGTGYARVAVASNLTAWSATDGPGVTGYSTGSSGRMSNNAAIVFPQPTANQGEARGVIVMDSPSGGNLLFRQALLSGGAPAAFTINAGGDAPRFEPDRLGISVR